MFADSSFPGLPHFAEGRGSCPAQNTHFPVIHHIVKGGSCPAQGGGVQQTGPPELRLLFGLSLTLLNPLRTRSPMTHFA